MIRFKRIVVQNFGSYGNYPTEVILDQHATNLIVGKNGSGKSTILLDGIFFVLFNRPYRKITKGLLVNSINNGGAMVEVEFETRGSTYIVRRGIKPNVFEITKDGSKLDLDVLSKDTQEFLEQDILQTNPKTFGQTAVLGSSSFVPFMQLPAAGRREVVDDVLDVHLFTRMSEMAKEDLSMTNKELSSKENALTLVKNQFTSQKQLIKVLESGQQDLINQLKEQLKEIEGEIKTLDARLSLYAGKTYDYHEVGKLENERIELSSKKGSIFSLKEKLSKIDSLDVCPTCFQKVDETHRKEVVNEVNESLAIAENRILELSTLIEAEDKLVKENKVVRDKEQEDQRQISNIERDIKSWSLKCDQVKAKIDDASSNSKEKLEDEKEKLKSLAEDGKVLTKEIDALKENKAIQELSVKLLKDNGIKASIIKEYLPTINSLINKNLLAYGFDVNFNLDENFEESVSSRGREKFTYHSFSEGEKERIDYSIMLALRTVGASKNATSINILVLDEILDGSLDKDSRAITLDILTRDMEESNVFVISHTESQPTFYERVLKVERKGDFSIIIEE